MSKRPPTLAAATTTREAIINGHADVFSGQTSQTAFIKVTENHGTRWLRLTAISQVIYDTGQLGGPWFVRCEGQQLRVSAESAQRIGQLLNLNLEDAA